MLYEIQEQPCSSLQQASSISWPSGSRGEEVFQGAQVCEEWKGRNYRNSGRIHSRGRGSTSNRSQRGTLYRWEMLKFECFNARRCKTDVILLSLTSACNSVQVIIPLFCGIYWETWCIYQGSATSLYNMWHDSPSHSPPWTKLVIDLLEVECTRHQGDLKFWCANIMSLPCVFETKYSVTVSMLRTTVCPGKAICNCAQLGSHLVSFQSMF